MRAAKKGIGLRFLRQRGGYIFAFCVFFVFLQAGLFAGHRHEQLASYPGVSSDTGGGWLPDTPSVFGFSSPNARLHSAIGEHPIPRLMEEAEDSFKKKLSGQSRTLRTAVATYRRRYKRDPPRGFDDWWKFAQRHEVKMVDEYDGLMEDLAPFWELSGEELRRRALQVASLSSIDLVRVRDGKVTTINLSSGSESPDVGARATGFLAMLERFVHTLPDMDFPINSRAEGRVLVPWEHRRFPNLTHEDSSVGVEAMLDGPFRPDWGGAGSVWDAWRRTCPPDSPARRLFSSLRSSFSHKVVNYLSTSFTKPGSDFSFVSGTSASTLDFCSRPHEHYNQGHFFSDWRTIPVLYPVFSPAKAKGFLDIKIPSHYYYGSTKRYTYGWDPVNLKLNEVDDMEVPWENKLDRMYWRGATTGGGNHPPGFSSQYHRHRFIRQTSDTSSTNRIVTFVDPPATGNYVTASVPVSWLNSETMDTAFVKAVAPEAYPGGLSSLTDTHRFGDAMALGKHWSYKYAVDLDGMGYSGRFMSFLASDSVPIKATVYEEYFKDWIQPWVHFIPLSSSYKEIYNIHAYFSGPTQSALEAVNSTQLSVPTTQRHGLVEGDRRLRRMARAGKQWKKTMGRTIDMEVYVYRLCLEWARLWADDRDSMDFTQ